MKYYNILFSTAEAVNLIVKWLAFKRIIILGLLAVSVKSDANESFAYRFTHDSGRPSGAGRLWKSESCQLSELL